MIRCGSRIPRRRGRRPSGGGGSQHTILPNSPKNCMKLITFSVMAGGASEALPSPLDPPLVILVSSFVENCADADARKIFSKRGYTALHLSIFILVQVGANCTGTPSPAPTPAGTPPPPLSYGCKAGCSHSITILRSVGHQKYTRQ